MIAADGEALRQLLAWYLAAGVDEAVADLPTDRFAAAEARRAPPPVSSPPAPAAAPAPIARAAPALPRGPALSPDSPAEAIAAARAAAAAAMSLDALRRAVADFDGCALKRHATTTVFADGNPEARIMFIGEAPGAEEDRQGLPFVGASGQLLDRMLATIGLDRSRVYITNVLFWRPPGNRKPTATEIAVCHPFVERHVALVGPELLVIVGGTASAALLPGSEGITRLRGRPLTLDIPGLAHPVQAIAMYHPSFLLRSPERKRETWQDLLLIQSRLTTKPK